jgi:hypothetical protein
LPRVQNNKIILKAARENHQVTYKEKPTIITTDIFSRNPKGQEGKE